MTVKLVMGAAVVIVVAAVLFRFLSVVIQSMNVTDFRRQVVMAVVSLLQTPSIGDADDAHVLQLLTNCLQAAGADVRLASNDVQVAGTSITLTYARIAPNGERATLVSLGKEPPDRGENYWLYTSPKPWLLEDQEVRVYVFDTGYWESLTDSQVSWYYQKRLDCLSNSQVSNEICYRAINGLEQLPASTLGRLLENPGGSSEAERGETELLRQLGFGVSD
jgi:hypothetical protein